MAKRIAKEVNVMELIEDLASIQCTKDEIAAIIKCDPTTLCKAPYSGIIAKGYLSGKESLRRSMWKSARGGNVTMQIWLSKQYLDMREPMKDVAPEVLKALRDAMNMSKEELKEKVKEDLKDVNP